MRFYRLAFYSGGGYVNDGYAFFATEDEAMHEREESVKVDPCSVGEVEILEIEPTHDGILAALREFAAHGEG